jgi:hypothetical protein
MRQITIEARLNPRHVDSGFSSVYTGQWSLPPISVRINGGSEQIVLAQGISPIKRTFSAPIGGEVEVLWHGDESTANVHVYYTDTPAANFNDNAKILVNSSTVRLPGGGSYATPVHGRFTVTAPGTQNSITYDVPAARQVTTAPGTFTVEINDNYGDKVWSEGVGSILISVNGGYPTPILEAPNKITIPTPHKVSFTARAGDRVQIIWKSATYSEEGQVLVYRSDRPAGSINDTANILGAIPCRQAEKPNGIGGRGYNVVADILVR